jgi:hypothetical protein
MSKLFIDAPNPSRLLIITHDDFVQAMMPLVHHKNLTGMPTHLIKLSKIVQSLPDFSTHPLAIKRVIAEGHESFGVYYVMLVGDASKIPTRHRFVRQPRPDISGLDGTYNPTDFYYANLYRPGGRTAGLSDWDVNNDGKYNESQWVEASAEAYNPDKVDGYMHVAVGRIPAHTVNDVTNYVSKVIDYEEGLRIRSIDDFTFLSDDSLDSSGRANDSIILQSSIENLQNANVKRFLVNTSPPALSVSTWKPISTVEDERAAFVAKWFIHIGHGSSTGWSIGLADGRNIDNSYVTMPINSRWNVNHSFSLPIILSAGCDTGQFLPNAGNTPDGSYRGLNPDKEHRIARNESTKKATDMGVLLESWPVAIPVPNPYDFPSISGRTFAHAWLCNSPTGGAIAYSGATVVHQGGLFGADLFLRMVRQVQKKNILGDIWAQAARDYLTDRLHIDHILGSPRIYLSIQSLYGDPSLRLTPVISYGLSAVMSGDRLTVFARTTHGTLTHKFYDPQNQKWTDWIHLGVGQISSGASAIVAGDRLTVFARTDHGTLTHKFYDPQQQKWTDWIHLESAAISSGATAVMAGDRLTVFARNEKGKLTHRFYEKQQQGWTDWIDLGDGQISSVSSAVMAGDRLTVFARTDHGTLTHKFYDPLQQRWTDWINLGDGQISSAPSAVMAGDRLTVFARTDHGTLTHKFYDPLQQKWTDWINLGDGQISSAPSAVMAGDRLAVFARTDHGTLTHKFYDPLQQKWTDWINLGDGQIS